MSEVFNFNINRYYCLVLGTHLVMIIDCACVALLLQRHFFDHSFNMDCVDNALPRIYKRYHYHCYSLLGETRLSLVVLFWQFCLTLFGGGGWSCWSELLLRMWIQIRLHLVRTLIFNITIYLSPTSTYVYHTYMYICTCMYLPTAIASYVPRTN